MDAVDLSVGAPSAPEVERDPTAPTTGPAPSGPRMPRRPRRDSLRDAGMPAAGDPIGELPQLVDEKRMRGLCKTLSGMLGAFAGDPDVERHWRFNDDELDELVPPLTRYVNRTPRLLVAVDKGDELEIALVLAGWTGRNITEGQRAREARREREREVEGAPAGSAGAGGVPGPVARPNSTGGVGGAVADGRGVG